MGSEKADAVSYQIIMLLKQQWIHFFLIFKLYMTKKKI
jgi:hypothetical protein